MTRKAATGKTKEGSREMAPVKRRKPRPLRKEESIRVRVTMEQKAALEEAARRIGIGVSSWLLTLGLREAHRDAASK